MTNTKVSIRFFEGFELVSATNQLEIASALSEEQDETINEEEGV